MVQNNLEANLASDTYYTDKLTLTMFPLPMLVHFLCLIATFVCFICILLLPQTTLSGFFKLLCFLLVRLCVYVRESVLPKATK